MRNTHPNKGESVLEILLAIAVFAVVMPTILYVVGLTADRQAKRNWYYESLLLLEDIKEIIKQKKTTDWNLFAQDASFSVVKNGQNWTFVQLEQQDLPQVPGIADDFVITLTSEDANRNSEGTIVPVGGYSDPATRRITIEIDWYGAVTKTSSTLYITRTDNLKTVSLTTKDDFENGGLFDGMMYNTQTSEVQMSQDDAPGPMPGVMTYWNMNGDNEGEGSEIDLAFGGTDNLLFEGEPLFVPSLFGKGLTIPNETTRLHASSSARLNLTGPATFVVWMMVDQDPTSPQTIFDKHTTQRGYALRLLPGGQVELTIGNGVQSVVARTSDSVISEDTWHVVGFVYDNEKITPYLDGEPNGNVVSGESQLYSATEILAIGNDNDRLQSRFVGVIDDVQLYTNALTAGDMKKLSMVSYESKPIDLGGSSMVHSLTSSVVKLEGERKLLRVHSGNKIAGECARPTSYVGPDGSEDTYYEVTSVGGSSASFAFPVGSFVDSAYTNPGECVSFKVETFWNKGKAQEESVPGFGNVQITYSL
jgi:hypothetical protein